MRTLARLATVAAVGMAAVACADQQITSPGAADGAPTLATVANSSGGLVTVLPTGVPNQFTEGWFGYGDRTAAAGEASITTAPGPQILGVGSLRMSNTAFGWEVAAYGSPAVPAGTPLADITALSYATYAPSGQAGITVQHVSLQFTIDYDLSDTFEGFQGRLVYEPYHCNTVASDIWSTWNTLEDGNGRGCWWGTGTPRVGGIAVAQQCPQSNPCTWAEFKTRYPNAGFHPTNAAQGIILKVGSPWTGTFYADALAVGVDGNTTTYDFEPYLVATTKDDCKDGGWQNARRADGSEFRNQGQCIQYVNTGK
jgi:hypothetical protein